MEKPHLQSYLRLELEVLVANSYLQAALLNPIQSPRHFQSLSYSPAAQVAKYSALSKSAKSLCSAYQLPHLLFVAVSLLIRSMAVD